MDSWFLVLERLVSPSLRPFSAGISQKVTQTALAIAMVDNTCKTMLRIMALTFVTLSTAADAADAAAPTEMINWATDWGGASDADGQSSQKMKKMVEEARQHEVEAKKELAEARADARMAAEKANAATAQAAVAGSAVTPEELKSAQEAEMQNEENAASAESEEQIHEARAQSAEKAARNSEVDPERREQAKRAAEIEGAAAARAEQSAAMYRLRAEASKEKLRRMQLEAVSSTSGSFHRRVEDMVIGGSLVGVIAFLTCLVTRKTKKAGEALKEPLLAAEMDPELVLADEAGDGRAAESPEGLALLFWGVNS
ncbi:hypothetical protein AK812_SmicGene37851 [Symbiodinium microadriaticum]|uniref:Uncharacterized protein n=1 Tax=Symbiodinium microadriaticum TaxID=2951 RepID=A0A1Q9CF83_SYMMI|nr:hypothetical protein AK812_SmicGene37851 [Symbiodinium microadriaticum]